MYRYLLTCAFLVLATAAHAAGVLSAGGTDMAITNHDVSVVINNGFAQTTVRQTFLNKADTSVEGLYRCPVPIGSSLSEVTIRYGETSLAGEVVRKQRAQTIYESERDQGNNAGLATRENYQAYNFAVANIPAQASIGIMYMYYQPLEIELGVGRYLYPLENGGTEDAASASFWSGNDQLEGHFHMDITIKSVWPLADVRIPGWQTMEQTNEQGDRVLTIESKDIQLNADVVLYYRLADDIPARVEMLAYKPSAQEEGTFMLILTPSFDLKPITQGRDWTFVLDRSGSMDGKLHMLAEGVSRSMQQFSTQDRFRILAFDDSTSYVVKKWTVATTENVQAAVTAVKNISSGGGTNLYDAIDVGLRGHDDDRASSVLLVTDGVTNQGIVDMKSFHKRMTTSDVRVFGFLLGNSANWPLMEMICDTSGGFYKQVSNRDDVIGTIVMAKEQVTHECLHDADLRIHGVHISQTSELSNTKVYRGQQLIIFGRYTDAGTAQVTLDARLTGEDKKYTTLFDFPQVATEHPELERLWAMNRVEHLERQSQIGTIAEGEYKNTIADIGVEYQIVTDETSFLILDDQQFARHGVERKNKKRLIQEKAAQQQRAQAPAQNHRVDTAQPMYSSNKAPRRSRSGGGGAFEPLWALLIIPLLYLGRRTSRKEY